MVSVISVAWKTETMCKFFLVEMSSEKIKIYFSEGDADKLNAIHVKPDIEWADLLEQISKKLDWSQSETRLWKKAKDKDSWIVVTSEVLTSEDDHLEKLDRIKAEKVIIAHSLTTNPQAPVKHLMSAARANYLIASRLWEMCWQGVSIWYIMGRILRIIEPSMNRQACISISKLDCFGALLFFSLLRNSFNEQQQSCLQCYIESMQ
jgi:hypothetical protein